MDNEVVITDTLLPESWVVVLDEDGNLILPPEVLPEGTEAVRVYQTANLGHLLLEPCVLMPLREYVRGSSDLDAPAGEPGR